MFLITVSVRFVGTTNQAVGIASDLVTARVEAGVLGNTMRVDTRSHMPLGEDAESTHTISLRYDGDNVETALNLQQRFTEVLEQNEVPGTVRLRIERTKTVAQLTSDAELTEI